MWKEICSTWVRPVREVWLMRELMPIIWAEQLPSGGWVGGRYDQDSVSIDLVIPPDLVANPWESLESLLGFVPFPCLVKVVIANLDPPIRSMTWMIYEQ